jgi:ribosomal protein L11 methyltransferase
MTFRMTARPELAVEITLTGAQVHEIANLTGVNITHLRMKRVDLAALALLAKARGSRAVPWTSSAIARMVEPTRSRNFARCLINIMCTTDQTEQIRNLTGMSFSSLLLAPDDMLVVFREGWNKETCPFRLGRSLVIVPAGQSHEARESDCVIGLPGDIGDSVFGTGLHVTTQLALALLEKHAKSGDRVLDLGTGSGILAVTAARLGAHEVLALDIEPAAVQAACRTVELNGLSSIIQVRVGIIEEMSDDFDLVVANIMAGFFVERAAALFRLVRPSGVLILSGVVSNRAPDVADAMGAAGFKLVEERTQDSWCALVFAR